MRISRRYGLIFLANPKCASTTVERYIDVYTNGDAEGPKGYPKHTNARILDRYMTEHGLSYDDFLVFTTIRNPWDRLVSLWTYARKQPDAFWFDAASSSRSLSDFLQTDIIQDHFVREFGLNGFTHTPDGRRIVDDVFCVEQYRSALPLMFRRLGIAFVDKGWRSNQSNRAKYQTYYDEADQHLVAELFKADIAYGGYRF
jgi:Sulfotransferase family